MWFEVFGRGSRLLFLQALQEDEGEEGVQHADGCGGEEQEVHVADDGLHEVLRQVELQLPCIGEEEGLEEDARGHREQPERQDEMEEARIFLRDEADERERCGEERPEEEDDGEHGHEPVCDILFEDGFDVFRGHLVARNVLEHADAVKSGERGEEIARSELLGRARFAHDVAHDVFHRGAALVGKEVTEQGTHEQKRREDEDHHVPGSAGFPVRRRGCASLPLCRFLVHGRGVDRSGVDGFRGESVGVLRHESGLRGSYGVAVGQPDRDLDAAVGTLDLMLVAVGQVRRVVGNLETNLGSAAWTSGVHNFLLIGILYDYIINGYSCKVNGNRNLFF